MKNDVKCLKDFLWYSTTLETYSDEKGSRESLIENVRFKWRIKLNSLAFLEHLNFIKSGSSEDRGVKSRSFLQRQLMIANYRVKKFVRNSQQS